MNSPSLPKDDVRANVAAPATWSAEKDRLFIEPVDDRIDLSELAASIRASSNFRFAWRFFETSGCNLRSEKTARILLDTVCTDDALHSFLSESFDDANGETFTIEVLHEHCSLRPDNRGFADVLARAANDHLGAYSRHLRNATAREMRVIDQLFSSISPYLAFSIVPGNVAGCAICKHYCYHSFSSWFYQVAWDFCYVVTWPELALCWIGCLTDTD